MKTWLLLLLAILAEVAGTTALKLSDGFSRPLPVLAVALTYGLAFYLLALTLRTLPLGVVYAVWSGVGIVGTTAAGWWLFRENLGPAQLAGIGLIVAGILVLNLTTRPV